MTQSILFVEDDATDRMFLKLSLDDSDLDVEASYCEDGLQALQFLKSHEAPDLIVTDLSMPGMDGVELTQTLKMDETFSGIPVLMLSTSNNKSDVRRFYGKAGNAYIRKPDSPEGYERVLSEISRFWFKVAERGS